MRIFISLAIFLVLALSFANAQTTLSNITVNGQAYDITYRTDVDFATYETTIDDAPWWQSSAKAFADAANVNNLRFAYDTITIGGNDYVCHRECWKTCYFAGTPLNVDHFFTQLSEKYLLRNQD